MNVRIRRAILTVAGLLCTSRLITQAQQKPQWMPGQVGLNAGILPSPGFTYVNIDINYNA